jgi:hypothetical protein
MTLTEVTSTKEKVHGVLRLEADALVVQWSTARETQRVGWSITTERALDPVREVRIPLAGLAGAAMRWQWRRWPPGPALLLRAADLRAFEDLRGDPALMLEHPAELSLAIRRRDRSLAHEFAAELEMQLADRALRVAEEPEPAPVGAGRDARRPPARLPRDESRGRERGS